MKVFEGRGVLEYLKKRSLGNLYMKAKQDIEEGRLQKVLFKVRKPKQN